MSSQKTEHYQLHAWEPSDPFLRGEFNANFSALDAVVHDGLTAVESLAQGRARLVAGTYTGNGVSLRGITLGFAPKVVVVVTPQGYTFEPGMLNYQLGGIFVTGMTHEKLQLTATGFTVAYKSDYGNYSMNTSGDTYFYFALG